MPLQIVHLLVADAAAEKLKVKDLPSFYLGSIAPDGVHMMENFTPEDKQRSHLGIRGTNDPVGNNEFLRNADHWGNRDYVMGFSLHSLTDLIWTTDFVPVWRKRCKALLPLGQPWKPVYYSDMDQLDWELYRTKPEVREILSSLSEARPVDLPYLLSAEAAEKWKQRDLQWFTKPKEYADPVRFTNLEEILEFISKAVDYATEYILAHL